MVDLMSTVAVHSFIPGTEAYLLLFVSTIMFLSGIILLLKRWGHGSAYLFLSVWKREVFSHGAWNAFKIFVLDLLLFRRIWNRSKSRWFSHMIFFWTFLLLGGCIVLSLAALFLSILDPGGFGGNFAQYLADLHVPYSLLVYPVLACTLFVLLRRVLLRKVRERTVIRDFFIIISILLITLTGMGAEWFSGFDLFVGEHLLNWDTALLILQIHLYAVFLLFIMVLPWTRLKHIITVPLLILARNGGE